MICVQARELAKFVVFGSLFGEEREESRIQFIIDFADNSYEQTLNKASKTESITTLFILWVV